MKRIIVIGLMLLLGFPMATQLSAAEIGTESKDKKSIDELRAEGYRIITAKQIFGQILVFTPPSGFEETNGKTQGNQYLYEQALRGEKLENWTQLFTIIGNKGLALKPIQPENYAAVMAGRYKEICPESYTAGKMDALKIKGVNAMAIILGCGTIEHNKEKISELALMIFIKGESDYYTFQWAERGKPSPTPLQIDEKKWYDRMNQLQPIKLCPIKPNPSEIYPSCSDEESPQK